jgi:hypothetical protein
MTADDFITDAIDRGQTDGIESLDANQRMVFLIAEAEAGCDMNGIDTFLGNYGPEWIPETAAAFDAVGASEIAAELRVAPLDSLFTGDTRLDRLNRLITSRIGYNYEAIRRMVEDRLRSQS